MRLDLIYYLTASLLGGLHALEPGHGKTVVAAYLIGSRGRKIDAVLLGLVVTLTHTFSVILLAIAAKVASDRVALTDEALHGYLGVVAGILILGVGAWMLVCRIRGTEPLHFHSHEHGHSHSHGRHDENAFDNQHDHSHVHDQDAHDHHNHGHAGPHNEVHGHSDNPGRYVFLDNGHGHSHDSHENHDHEHEHGPDGRHDEHEVHGHSHNPGRRPEDIDSQGEKRPGYWQLFLLGVSGGLIPCPAAIAILLAAVAAGKLGEGLTYILLFSLGLATVLVAIGLAVVGAGKLASRFLDAKKFAKRIAIASAALVTLIGVVTVVNSVRHVI